MSSRLSRRKFLRASAGVVGVGGAALLAGCPEDQSAPPTSSTVTAPAAAAGATETAVAGKVGANRLVGHPVEGIEAVMAQGADRADLVQKALEAYGGMGAFVQRGSRVVIKPNLGWAKDPADGVDTHPEVVAAVVNLCKEAGAKEIIIGEHPCDDWTMVKEFSGMPDVAEATGASLIGWGEDARSYKEVDFTEGKSTTGDLVALDVLECDVLINCPKIKHHSATEICGAMKNQLGLILRPQDYHQTTNTMAQDPNLHVNIADLASAVRPTLTVVDGTNCCVTEGPKGGPTSEVRDFDTIIVSSDIVACDSLGTELLGICTVEDVNHIRIAADERGLGNILTKEDERVKIV